MLGWLHFGISLITNGQKFWCRYAANEAQFGQPFKEDVMKKILRTGQILLGILEVVVNFIGVLKWSRVIF